MLEFLDAKLHPPLTVMSPQFIYYDERVAENSVPNDSGAQIRDGIKTLAQFGCCTEDLCPYDPSTFTIRPTDAAYADGAIRKILQYQRVEGLDSMRACLARGYPFVFGFTVYDSFESDKTTQTGVMSMPSPDESVLGGHAVMAVGYRDRDRYIIVRNSWSDQWGDHGYFYMPYDYIGNTDLADDMWMVTLTAGS